MTYSNTGGSACYAEFGMLSTSQVHDTTPPPLPLHATAASATRSCRAQRAIFFIFYMSIRSETGKPACLPRLAATSAAATVKFLSYYSFCPTRWLAGG